MTKPKYVMVIEEHLIVISVVRVVSPVACVIMKTNLRHAIFPWYIFHLRKQNWLAQLIASLPFYDTIYTAFHIFMFKSF